VKKSRENTSMEKRISMRRGPKGIRRKVKKITTTTLQALGEEKPIRNAGAALL